MLEKNRERRRRVLSISPSRQPTPSQRNASRRAEKKFCIPFALFRVFFASHIFSSLEYIWWSSVCFSINFHFYYYNFFSSAFGVCRKKIINSRLKPPEWRRCDDDKNKKIFFSTAGAWNFYVILMARGIHLKERVPWCGWRFMDLLISDGIIFRVILGETSRTFKIIDVTREWLLRSRRSERIILASRGIKANLKTPKFPTRHMTIKKMNKHSTSCELFLKNKLGKCVLGEKCAEKGISSEWKIYES